MKQFRNSPTGIAKDILAGIIVALVSIPIAMGYAQIAGLPMVYGLYGSILPVLLFGLLTTTDNFVFGVDAAPCALVGGILAEMGIAGGSAEALQVVPLITFFAACWLLLFRVVKAGKVVRYISTPVMGGFVSGICCTIILMQLPKLWGGAPGVGEVPALIVHIVSELPAFNAVSLLLGAGTLVLLRFCKKKLPKFPAAVAAMVIGALLSRYCSISSFGVTLLPTVQAGLPRFQLLDFRTAHLTAIIFNALSIALVVTAETLLGSRGFAVKDGIRMDNNREILAYSVCSFAAASIGCCPVNGSVSRTGIARRFGARSQWMSVTACIAMAVILLYGADYIQYLPVPVLAAIVIDALINACEFELAARLRRVSRSDFRIFAAAFCGVLLFGTVYGVVIGVVLSFIAVTVRSVDPPRGFLGVVPGEEGFYSLSRNHDAEALPDTILYRFSGNLFFANIDLFQDDIENALAAAPSSKQVIVNAGGIGMIDITAADRLVLLYRSLQKRGIRFYITEHAGDLNDQLRRYGAEELLQNGVLQMTVELALEDAGITRPYGTAAKEPAARTAAGEEETGPTPQAPEQAAEKPADSAGGSAQKKWMFGDTGSDTEENGLEEKGGNKNG